MRQNAASRLNLSLLVALVATVVLPGSVSALSLSPDPQVFHWQREQLFQVLEVEFNKARNTPARTINQRFVALENQGSIILTVIDAGNTRAPMQGLARLEEIQFRLAALAAAKPALLPRAQEFVNRVRISVMRAARTWKSDKNEVHEAIYRVVYGGRSAIEEALVQNRATDLPALMKLEAVPSGAPSIMIEGVRVHSGDILLSRGGAPTSALIARGNTFPGNFSHVALAHVDAKTGVATVIESVIEKGTILTSVEEYLKDKKLRILLLRLRPEHPVLQRDPLAPHQAASSMLARARNKHVPYDFSMNWKDASRFFCSEVPYHAYRSVGIGLWRYKSRITSPGLISWLGSLGAEHFTTLVPSDLEYDPQLAAVVEWRNTETIKQDRLDNVTLDALLEGAEQGDRLEYAGYELPLVGLAKVWSVFQSSIGLTPKIPEGMSITSALRANSLISQIHPRLRQEIEKAAKDFQASNGYPPPYWILSKLARQSLDKLRPHLAPALVNTRNKSRGRVEGRLLQVYRRAV